MAPWPSHCPERHRPIDTYAVSQTAFTASTAAAAVEQTLTGNFGKIAKYSNISGTHRFVSIAIETGGTWDKPPYFVSELGWRTPVESSAGMGTAEKPR